MYRMLFCVKRYLAIWRDFWRDQSSNVVKRIVKNKIVNTIAIPTLFAMSTSAKLMLQVANHRQEYHSLVVAPYRQGN